MIVKHLPISKSIANRILILQAMQGQPLVLDCDEQDLCDDIYLLRNALQQIRDIQKSSEHEKVSPQGGTEGGLFLDNCGTAMRFLTAYCAVQDGLDIVLTGSERMQERPIGQLVEALRSVGADIEYLGNEGFPPLRIHGKTLLRVPITLNDVASSQFVSALMLVGFPVETNAPSPYIQMTRELIENYQLSIINYQLERDWSAASYWYEYVALYGGEILFPNLSFQTLQGDAAVAHIFESFGVHTEETAEGIRIYKNINVTQHPPVETPFMASPIDTTLSLPLWRESEGAVLNFSTYPDLYPAVYVTCHKLGIILQATGTERLPYKESNRLQAFDQLHTPHHASRTLHSYGDHRIAMALLVAGYQVDDIDCISKSYPQFINQLRNITFVIPYRSSCGVPTSEKQAYGESGDLGHFNGSIACGGDTPCDPSVERVNDEGKGKKYALYKGISQATTEYVWLTDDDVTRTHYPIFVPPTLLGDLTILPLRMDQTNDKRRTALSELQITEYLALQSLTLWAAEHNHAVMCSGANMIVNRQRWLESFADLHHEIPSGDDMFLLESFKRRKLSIKALYAPEYIATIQPEPTWKAFFRQRMRWAGKAPKYTDRYILLCGMLTFVANLIVLLCPPLVIFKYPIDLHFIHKAKQYNLTTPSSPLYGGIEGGFSFLLSLLYPWYILICLIGGLIRQQKW